MNRCVQLQPLSKRLKLIDEQPRDCERAEKRVEIYVRRRWNKKYFIIDGKMNRANFSETKHLSSWSPHINKQCSECAFVHVNFLSHFPFLSYFSLQHFAPLFSPPLRESWELFSALSALRKGMKFSIWLLLHCFVINSVGGLKYFVAGADEPYLAHESSEKPESAPPSPTNTALAETMSSNCCWIFQIAFRKRLYGETLRRDKEEWRWMNLRQFNYYYPPMLSEISALMKIPTRNE